jgi:hypothetical protein
MRKKNKETRTSREARCCLLQPKKNQHQGFFSWVVEDDNELEGSSSSYGFLCFFSLIIAEDDDEWGGSSLSSAMQEKIKDKDEAHSLLSFALVS